MKNKISGKCPGPSSGHPRWYPRHPEAFKIPQTIIFSSPGTSNLTNIDSTEKKKVSIDIDPGKRQELRKQCTFEFQFDSFFVKWLVEHISTGGKLYRVIRGQNKALWWPPKTEAFLCFNTSKSNFLNSFKVLISKDQTLSCLNSDPPPLRPNILFFDVQELAPSSHLGRKRQWTMKIMESVQGHLRWYPRHPEAFKIPQTIISVHPEPQNWKTLIAQKREKLA